MNKVYANFIIIVFIGIIASSCFKKDIDKVSITDEFPSSWAAPVGKGEFVLKNVIFGLDSAIKQYDDSLIYVLFEQSLFSMESDELVDISDLIMPTQNLPTLNYPFTEDSLVLNLDPVSIDFGTPSADSQYIDSIVLNSANLKINVSTTDVSPSRLVFIFGGIIRNGNPLTINIDLTSQDNYNNTYTLTTGDKLDYTTGTGNNNFPFAAKLVAYQGTRSNLIGNISVGISLTDIDFSRVHGYFGRYTKTTDPYNIEMTVFELMPENAEFFQEPSIVLYMINSIGIPISIYFDQMQFVSTQSSSTLNLSGSGVPTDTSTSRIINYPRSYTEGTVNDSLPFDTETSNIDDALHMAPNQLNIQASTYLNQKGYTNENFISTQNSLALSFKIELPLAAKIQEFSLGDTIPFSFGDIADDLSIIKKVLLKLTVQNGFPTDGELEVGLLDENMNLLKTLEQVNILESGVVEDGEVVEITKSNPELSISRDEVQQFSNTSYLSFKITVKTVKNGNEWVKFYSFYSIKMTVGVLAELDINTNEI